MLNFALLSACSPTVHTAPHEARASTLDLVSDTQWSAAVERLLRDDSYQLRRGADGRAHLVDLARGLRLGTTDAGTVLSPVGTSADPAWSVELRTVRLSRTESWPLVAQAVGEGACVGTASDAHGDCIRRLQRSLTHGVVEWWTNGEEGLRQGWTIEEEPGGTGPIHLDVAIDGMEVELQADGAVLSNPLASFRYGDLLAWDAEGTRLDATMSATPDGLRVSVEVQAAVFPVTIDPLASDPDWTDDGTELVAQFGRYLGGIGDLNGDGYDEIGIASAHISTVYLYAGSPSGLPVSPTWVRIGEAFDDNFGIEVNGRFDANGDGFGDLIIGALDHDDGATIDAGKVHVYYGSPTGPPAFASWSRMGSAADDHLGSGAISAGDVNGDGFDDLLVGAPGDLNVYVPGTVRLWLGSITGLGTSPVWIQSGPYLGSRFGVGLTDMGDVNGDTFDDFAVSTAPPTTANEARVFAYYGSATLPSSTADWSAIGDGGTGHFGSPRTLDGAGDVDADGFDDLIIGARGHGIGGKVYLFRGSAAGLSVVPDWTFVGSFVSLLGFGVSGAGDINQDGFDDVLVGAPNSDEAFPGGGLAHLFLGSASGLDAAPAWTAYGDEADHFFGHAVDSAGDLNGDTFPDVLIGGYGRNVETGRASVFYGTAPNVPPVAVTDGPYSGVEGSSIAVDGSGSTDSDGVIVAWRWDCDGDGDVDATGEVATCVLPDDGTFSLVLEVEDDGGAVGSITVAMVTSNANPLVDLGADVTANEGETLAFSATVSDPGSADTLTYEADCGAGYAAVGSASFDCTFADDGLFTVRLRVTDDDGGVGVDTLLAEVANVAPTVDLGPDQSGSVGQVFFFVCDISDPGLETFSYVIDCGAGAGPQPSPFPIFSCIYLTNGGFAASCTADDGDGGSGTGTAHVAVGFLDVDGDGFEAEATGGDDCDDGDPSVHPGAADSFGDGIDQNCDGWDGTVVDVTALEAGDLVVEELMDNPFSGPGGSSLWFEMRNTTSNPIDLNGLVVDVGTDEIVSGTTAPLPPGALSVVGLSASSNGGAPVDIVLPGMGSISSVVLRRPGGFQISSRSGSGFVGSSTSVDSVGQICIGRAPFGDGDFGTPGTDNPSCDFTLDSHYVWTLDAAFYADGDVLVNLVHGGASFSTSNSGEGLGWYLVSDTAGQTLSFTYDTTNVTWQGTRAFGQPCWTAGTMSNLPAGFAGTWTGCP